MLTAGLAKRYAKALLSAVSRGEAVEKTAEDLKMVLQVWAGNSVLRVCLSSPIVSMPVKQKVVNELLAGKIEALTINFLCLLIEKQRFALLPAISAALDELIEEMRGITRASLVSALPVQDSERDYLHRRLERWLKQSVQLSIEINPSLLCGIQVRIGDRLFDGSGLGHLNQMRAALSAF